MKLEPRKPPRDVKTGKLCAIEPRVVEEVPTTDEWLELVEREIGFVPRVELALFDPFERYEEATIETKLGGWPAWLSGPENLGKPLAQIVADETIESGFTEDGRLFVFDVPERGLQVLTQGY